MDANFGSLRAISISAISLIFIIISYDSYTLTWVPGGITSISMALICIEGLKFSSITQNPVMAAFPAEVSISRVKPPSV